jgi:hypothetical protein
VAAKHLPDPIWGRPGSRPSGGEQALKPPALGPGRDGRGRRQRSAPPPSWRAGWAFSAPDAPSGEASPCRGGRPLASRRSRWSGAPRSAGRPARRLSWRPRRRALGGSRTARPTQLGRGLSRLKSYRSPGNCRENLESVQASAFIRADCPRLTALAAFLRSLPFPRRATVAEPQIQNAPGRDNAPAQSWAVGGDDLRRDWCVGRSTEEPALGSSRRSAIMAQACAPGPA